MPFYIQIPILNLMHINAIFWLYGKSTSDSITLVDFFKIVLRKLVAWCSKYTKHITKWQAKKHLTGSNWYQQVARMILAAISCKTLGAFFLIKKGRESYYRSYCSSLQLLLSSRYFSSLICYMLAWILPVEFNPDWASLIFFSNQINHFIAAFSSFFSFYSLIRSFVQYELSKGSCSRRRAVSVLSSIPIASDQEEHATVERQQWEGCDYKHSKQLPICQWK